MAETSERNDPAAGSSSTGPAHCRPGDPPTPTECQSPNEIIPSESGTNQKSDEDENTNSLSRVMDVFCPKERGKVDCEDGETKVRLWETEAEDEANAIVAEINNYINGLSQEYDEEQELEWECPGMHVQDLFFLRKGDSPWHQTSAVTAASFSGREATTLISSSLAMRLSGSTLDETSTDCSSVQLPDQDDPPKCLKRPNDSTRNEEHDEKRLCQYSSPMQESMGSSSNQQECRSQAANICANEPAKQRCLGGYASTQRKNPGLTTLKKQLPIIRHTLLGNATHPPSPPPKEVIVHNSNMFDFHPILSWKEQELAWLMEESLYCQETLDWAFIMDYASPSLQIDLRQMYGEVTIRKQAEKAFQEKRSEVRRLLLEGVRRNRTMSSVIALNRLQKRGLLPRELGNIQATQHNSIVSFEPTTKMKKQPVRKDGHTKEPKGHAPQEIHSNKAKTASELGANEIRDPTSSMTPAPCPSPSHLKENFSIRIDCSSFLLNSLEQEVAWLVEESVLGNPDPKGLDFSFVLANASPKLRSMLGTCGRRWLPRVVRFHDPPIKNQFQHFRDHVRAALYGGFRRAETKNALPKHHCPLPVAQRVQLSFLQSKCTAALPLDVTKALNQAILQVNQGSESCS